MLERIRQLDAAIAERQERIVGINREIFAAQRERDALFGALSDEEKASLNPPSPAPAPAVEPNESKSSEA